MTGPAGAPTADPVADPVADPAGDLADDLLTLVDRSPSPLHAVLELTRRLRAAGFRELAETDRWELAPGERVYVIRGASLVAARIGEAPLTVAGARLIGAHTDSPTFKVRPVHDLRRAGVRQIGVEPYGSPLVHSWLDRELTVAGRLAVRSGQGVAVVPVVLPGAPLRLPSLAIHLDRAIREDGLNLNPQEQLVPLWGPDGPGAPRLLAELAAVAGVDPGDVTGHDLVLADAQPAARTGVGGCWLAAPRLDNLSSCHAGLWALLAAADAGTPHTVTLVAYDHEEIGSGSAEGARGSFLADVWQRLVAAAGEEDPQAPHRAIARSRLVSCDTTHAVHPNFEIRHEPAHRPAFGGGPVIKTNAGRAYASDADSGGWFTARCADAGVPVQQFVSRADVPCGSTIGPLTATRLGISTVDVGLPILAMHSVRELAAADDVSLLIRALTACLVLG